MFRQDKAVSREWQIQTEKRGKELSPFISMIHLRRQVFFIFLFFFCLFVCFLYERGFYLEGSGKKIKEKKN